MHDEEDCNGPAIVLESIKSDRFDKSLIVPRHILFRVVAQRHIGGDFSPKRPGRPLPEGWKAGEPRGHYYVASNGIILGSKTCPELAASGAVYLRGSNRAEDDHVLETTAERFERIVAAVKEYNAAMAAKCPEESAGTGFRTVRHC